MLTKHSVDAYYARAKDNDDLGELSLHKVWVVWGGSPEWPWASPASLQASHDSVQRKRFLQMPTTRLATTGLPLFTGGAPAGMSPAGEALRGAGGLQGWGGLC